MKVAGLVLAAGLARRFGGRKMLARLDGEPLLAHVLRAARRASLAETVVVLGHDHAQVVRAVDLAGVRTIINPEPERGLSSSLRLGLAALGADVEATLILLGDQPRIRADVIDRLLASEIPAGRLFVVPRYADGGGPNPALALRAAWPMAAELRGDRGMGPLLAAHPQLVVEVPVSGSNPDIDTLNDLATLER
jgi:molybdenum cofactor cytidylyltransferase